MGRFIFFILTLVLLSSCTDKPANYANGRTGEVLIICDDEVWEGEVQMLTDSLMTQFILPYIPDVVTFDLIQRSEKRLSPALKKYRNVISMKIDPNYKGKNGDVLQRKDVWAAGQVVFEITVKNKAQLLETLSGSLNNIHSALEKSLRERIIVEYDRAKNEPINRQLKKLYGINLSIPAKSKLVSNQDGFVRIEFPEFAKRMDLKGNTPVSDAGRIFSGVMVYQFDYEGPEQLALHPLCRMRDSILKIYAPHEVEGMYMTTQYGELTFPVGSEATTVKNAKGFEIRGMYKFVGAGMSGTGGPFWDFYTVNKKTNKVICVSTYLDISPMTNWTDYIRSIEAVWQSTKLVK